MSPLATATTTTRAATNRENAQHSTGPRTAEGKTRIRFNAMQHGLYSDTVILPCEDRQAFDRFTETVNQRYAPQTEEEQRLVLVIRDSEWRINRIKSIESGVLALATDEHWEAMEERYPDLDDITIEILARSAGYLVRSREIDHLHRHEGRLDRLREKTIREYQLLVRGRGVLPQAPAVPTKVEVAEAREEEVAEEVGFVPADFPEAAAAPAQPRVAMPKFSGPNRKQQRKEWLRTQAKKDAAA